MRRVADLRIYPQPTCRRGVPSDWGVRAHCLDRSDAWTVGGAGRCMHVEGKGSKRHGLLHEGEAGFTAPTERASRVRVSDRTAPCDAAAPSAIRRQCHSTKESGRAQPAPDCQRCYYLRLRGRQPPEGSSAEPDSNHGRPRHAGLREGLLDGVRARTRGAGPRVP